jgi:anti-sigma regulatory factor (Ser/Thr protein kinase)
MEFNAHQLFPVADRSYFNIIKREIQKLAEENGFPENRRGKIDIIVSELTSNLIKHTTQGGEILVKLTGRDKTTGIEIISVDNGPGMAEPQRMMEDGFSTVGSKGEGLGAIKRLSDDFDLYSLRGNGTVILSRVYISERNKRTKNEPEPFYSGAVMVAKSGETYSGDAWCILPYQNKCAIITLDGLGHGLYAHEAASEALQSFTENLSDDAVKILKHIHEDIRKTRGAVGAISIVHPKENTLTFCGIGNIAGKIISTEGSKNLLSYNGTLGHNIPNTINNHIHPWSEDSLLVLHSDGLKSKWDLSKYPHIKRHDASVIAAVLYKDHTRKTDDVLVIVGKNNK